MYEIKHMDTFLKTLPTCLHEQVIWFCKDSKRSHRNPQAIKPFQSLVSKRKAIYFVNLTNKIYRSSMTISGIVAKRVEVLQIFHSLKYVKYNR